jgi:hypothetical protein
VREKARYYYYAYITQLMLCILLYTYRYLNTK